MMFDHHLIRFVKFHCLFVVSSLSFTMLRRFCHIRDSLAISVRWTFISVYYYLIPSFAHTHKHFVIWLALKLLMKTETNKQQAFHLLSNDLSLICIKRTFDVLRLHNAMWCISVHGIFLLNYNFHLCVSLFNVNINIFMVTMRFYALNHTKFAILLCNDIPKPFF